jgi:DNA-binding transcriptional MerR regulator
MIGGVSTARRLVDSSNSPNQMTIEELAAESGMSVRNIRAHQARGLLSPPEVRMRVGYYGPEHVAQLRLIRDLQGEGFNLGGIKRLLEDTEGTAERLLRFKESLVAPLSGERPETLTTTELGRRFRVRGADGRDVLAKAEKLGVLVPVGSDRYEAPRPSLLALAEEAVRRGISVHSVLDILEDIERHCDDMSHSFIGLWLHEVWKPFQQAHMPVERWPEMQEAVERLGPIASEALIAIFQQRLGVEVERTFAEITRRLSAQEGD